MKAIITTDFKTRILVAVLLLSLVPGFFGNAARVFAHGGEHHGSEKPKAATTEKGTVSRSARLGEFEITLKHPALEPDAATAARLFVTKFETNEAIGDAAPTMEMESPNGAVTQVAVEKADVAGIWNLKIPALVKGNYTIRVSLKSVKGSDTATFSSVEIAHHDGADAATGDTVASRLGTLMPFIVGLIFLALFAGLFYFVWRMADEKAVVEKVVAA